MKSIFILFALLIAGTQSSVVFRSMHSQTIGEIDKDNGSADDPCSACRNTTITITDTWAGHCFPTGEGATCACLCGEVFCDINEIIDRSTCVPDGRLEDCRCIPVTTTLEPPTTVFDACSACRNRNITIGDNWAGHCFPIEEGPTCACVCGSVFCQENEVIDRSTCVPDGRLEDCTCIPVTTTIAPPTTEFDSCYGCRNTTIIITDTWAGHCFPTGEGSACACVCGEVLCDINEIIDRSTCVPDGMLEDCRCIPVSTLEPPTTVFDACSACRDRNITITDTWAGHCFPTGEGPTCACVCGSVFCQENEVIDRSTCVPDGRLEDCRCISVTTTLAPPTTEFDSCSGCRNTTITITDTWAGHCFPTEEGSECVCVCGDVFCFDNEVIDRSTCVPDGRLEDCRCIPAMTTLDPPTTVFDPCSECRNSTISITDTWAGHCIPIGEGPSCRCECNSIFCRENEVIDRSTCVPEGRLEDCRCIPGTTTLYPPTTVEDPCGSCHNTQISIFWNWAFHCRPFEEGTTCDCVCPDVICPINEVIDTSTCVPDGRIENCRCIPWWWK